MCFKNQNLCFNWNCYCKDKPIVPGSVNTGDTAYNCSGHISYKEEIFDHKTNSVTIDPVLKDTSSEQRSQNELINHLGKYFHSKSKLDLTVYVSRKLTKLILNVFPKYNVLCAMYIYKLASVMTSNSFYFPQWFSTLQQKLQEKSGFIWVIEKKNCCHYSDTEKSKSEQVTLTTNGFDFHKLTNSQSSIHQIHDTNGKTSF